MKMCGVPWTTWREFDTRRVLDPKKSLLKAVENEAFAFEKKWLWIEDFRMVRTLKALTIRQAVTRINQQTIELQP